MLWNAVVVIEVGTDGRPFQEEVPHHCRIADSDRVGLGGRIMGMAEYDEAVEEWVYDRDLVT
jgi:hypothetical protein